MQSDPTRRQFMAAVGGVALGGSLGVTGRSSATAVSSGSWPQCGYDPANTGYAAGRPAPVGNVSQQWTTEIDGSLYPQQRSLVVADGTGYLGSSGRVYALSLADGRERWSVETDETTSSPAVAAETVYVGSGSDLLALDRADGTERWRYSAPGNLWSPPTVADGTVYVVDESGSPYAVEAESGAEQWVFDEMLFSDYREGPPAVAGGSVYVTNVEEGTIYALDASDGSKRWDRTITDGRAEGTPTVVDDTVYATGGGTLFALNTADGTERWRFEIPGSDQKIAASPAVGDGTAFVGSVYEWRGDDDTGLHAVDTADGTRRWSYTDISEVRASPVVANETVYVGDEAGTFHAVATTDGRPRWTFEIGDHIRTDAAVVDGAVYVGGRRQPLYAITGATTPPAPTPTPAGTASPTMGTPSPTPTGSGAGTGSGQGPLDSVVPRLRPGADGVEQFVAENTPFPLIPATVAAVLGAVTLPYLPEIADRVTESSPATPSEPDDDGGHSGSGGGTTERAGGGSRTGPASTGTSTSASGSSTRTTDSTVTDTKSATSAGAAGANGVSGATGPADSSASGADGSVGEPAANGSTGGSLGDDSTDESAGDPAATGTVGGAEGPTNADGTGPDQSRTAAATADGSEPSQESGPGSGATVADASGSGSDDGASSWDWVADPGTDQIPAIETVASPPRTTVPRDDLTIVRELGRGGQAVVYEAELPDGPPDRVAMRTLGWPEGASAETFDRAELDRFFERAERWAAVDAREREKQRWTESDHIVGVVDIGETLPWIAIEYMDGGDLGDRLASDPGGLPVAEALWIGECLCKGAAVAHSLGISHLDLKPENVLLRETDGWDWPKIADWGLSRTLRDETGSAEGLSVAFAAPEQFDAGTFGDPDQLTDIYQIGAVVYALLTGSQPFDGSQFEMMRAVTGGGAVPPPSERRPALPAPVDAAVGLALERAKTARYDSVSEFEKALRAIRTNGRLPGVVTDRLNR